MKTIKILDTTLRDGEQSPGCSMNLQEKLEMAQQLERLGVDIIEAGFPTTSPDDFEAVRQIAGVIKNCTVTGLTRAVIADIQRTYDALKNAADPMIHIVLATSDLHMEHKLHMTREQVLQRIDESVRFARSLCQKVEFSAEDASRSDREFLVEACNTAIRAGACTVDITDTVGYAIPNEFAELIAYIKERLIDPEVTVAVHCHDDLGMAVANSISGIMAGATQVEGTINGIGERAGNTALEEVIMALHSRGGQLPAKTRVNTRQIYRTSKLLSTIIGMKIPQNKAIVGKNAFAHEAGIHQHGMLQNRSTYEIIHPEDVGIYQTQMVLGKHSGKHAFSERVAELGYHLSEQAIDATFEKFKVLADRKKDITDRDIEAIVAQAGDLLHETYALHSFVVNSGTVISATAVVKLTHDGKEYEHVARGEGPIDAAFKAIDRIVKRDYKLKNYGIQAVTEGVDALGEVVVKIERDGQTVTGRGLSTDIIEASLKAYLNAINKAIAYSS